MLIAEVLYRWTQIAILLGLPALLLIRGLVKRRFRLGIVTAVAALLGLTLVCSIFTAEETTTVLRVEAGPRITKSVLIGTLRYRFASGAEAAIAAAGRQA